MHCYKSCVNHKIKRGIRQPNQSIMSAKAPIPIVGENSDGHFSFLICVVCQFSVRMLRSRHKLLVEVMNQLSTAK